MTDRPHRPGRVRGAAADMDSPLRRVAVTGATGLLGGAVVAELLSRGVEVVAIARNVVRARQMLGNRRGLQILVGDMLDVQSFESGLHGVDAIIHTAAYFREYYQRRADAALLGRTNVTAVGELIEVADRADVPVLVHVSSAGTLGPGSPDHPSDEGTATWKALRRNNYYASKVRAEQLIQTLRPTVSVRIPVVVPAWMWGPGDAGPTASGQLFLSVATGVMTTIPRVSAHMVDARDVAAACVRAAERGQDRRYVVAGPRHDLPAVCAQIAQLCDAPVPRAVPAQLALAGSGVVQLSDQLRHRPPLVTMRGTRVLIDMDRQWISSERALAELGVTFRPVDETLRDEAAWFRQQGLISTGLVSIDGRVE